MISASTGETTIRNLQGRRLIPEAQIGAVCVEAVVILYARN